jgi:hypothetical protein
VVQDLADQYDDELAIISYHVNGDAYSTTWGQDRLDDFYGQVALVPTFAVDGLLLCPASDYRFCVEDRLGDTTDVTIELSGDPAGGSEWDITARVCREGGGSSRTMRIYTADTLNGYPNPPRHSTNVLMQNVFTDSVSLAGGECENVTTRIDFTSTSMSNSSDIVIVVWAQKIGATAPTTVYQAATMGWPFPAGGGGLDDIEITPSSATVYLGESVDFTATGFDEFGEEFPLDDPTWSKGSGLGDGTFDPGAGPTTTFTATGLGTRQIICSDGDITGGAIVTIREAPVLTGIVIDPSSATVDVDGQIVFTASGEDQYGGAFPLDNPSWTISGTGDGFFDPETGQTTTFTATYPGAAVVTCSDGDVSATAEIEILGDDPRLATITIDPATAQTRVDGSVQFTAAGADQYGRPFDLAEPGWRFEGSGGGYLDPASGSAQTTFFATGEGSGQVICAADGIEGAATVVIDPRGLPAPRKVDRRVTP